MFSQRVEHAIRFRDNARRRLRDNGTDTGTGGLEWQSGDCSQADVSVLGGYVLHYIGGLRLDVHGFPFSGNSQAYGYPNRNRRSDHHVLFCWLKALRSDVEVIRVEWNIIELELPVCVRGRGLFIASGRIL